MKHFYLLLFLVAFNVGFSQSFDASDRDPDFNAYPLPLNHLFIDKEVIKSQVQPDGNILVMYDGNKFVKMNGNLRVSNFNTGSGFSAGSEYAILQDFAVQPDGKILVGGNFSSYNGQAKSKIARLHPDGSLDTSFDAPLGAITNYGVLQIYVLSDGKIIVITDSAQNGNYYNNIFRLNANGTIDTSFIIPINYRFLKAAALPDGKLIVSHNTNNDFYSDVAKLSRLNVNGSFDAGFTTATFGALADNPVLISDICLQADGKILAGGKFNGANSTPSRDLARLNSNGTIDLSFGIASGFDASENFSNIQFDYVKDIALQADNKIVASGNFTSYNGTERLNVIRLDENGTVDSSFLDTSDFANVGLINSISFFNDEKILLSGKRDYRQRYDSFIVKVNPDGTKDPSYNNVTRGFFGSPVKIVSEATDGKLLVGGSFSTYNDKKCFGFTRLNTDGSVDTSFTYGGGLGLETSPKFAITAMAQQSDGKIYVGGEFSSYNGIETKDIIRVNADGSRDMAFDVDSGFDFGFANPGKINCIITKPSGGILVAGTFSNYRGNSCSGLVSLGSTGYEDAFYAEIGNTITQIKYQADGKLLVSTKNFSIGGLKRYLAGTNNLDPGFNLDPLIANPVVNSFEILQDDKILINGEFTINGEKRSLVRIFSNGALDTTFGYSSQNENNTIYSFASLPDLKVLVNGNPQGSPYAYVFKRLNSNGTVDATFEQQESEFGIQFSNVSGKTYVHGELTTYEEMPAWGLIRLRGDNYYFLNGQNRLDLGNNGCDASDGVFSNIKYEVVNTNGTNSFDFVANTSGSYHMGMTSGSYTMTPVFENPGYFSASPSGISVNFPAQTTPQLQNFCIAPTGNFPDLETVIFPINAARPGFDAKYKIILKNKGNQSQSGTVSIAFDDNMMDFVGAVPAVSNQSLNNLGWTFSNLNPFQTREMTVTFNINTPMETPAVDSGTVLPYTVAVTSGLTDVTPTDNVFAFNQVVVNSLDPNDKTCLEGTAISATKVGDYVHYVIRFENSGTYAAQHITVKDIIDVSKYDIDTLIPLNGSHAFVTRIANVNVVEFYFEDINLPFADATNDGYVSFKIKTKSDLAAGDSFQNTAAIYFDYNTPIVTNTAITNVEAPLKNPEFANGHLEMYPNPVRDVLTIAVENNEEITSVSIYDTMGKLLMVLPNHGNTIAIDTSGLAAGYYIARIQSGKGILAKKFIKT